MASESGRGIVPVPLLDRVGTQAGLYKESHALLIGVSDYTAGWPDLPGVLVDIPQIRNILERHGFNVTTVKNPTHKALTEAFTDFINRYGQGKDNRLLIYFAGHGHTVKLSYGAEMGFIVPADAPDPARNPNGFLAKGLDMQQIEVYAKRIQSKHALFLFDSCFSGSLFGRARAAPPQSIEFKVGKPVRQFITSGSAGEQVSDDSVFRRLFIAALKGEGDANRDGYVTGTELGAFLQNGVINYTRASQHPQYGTLRDPYLDKGDFVFPLETPDRQTPRLTKRETEINALESEKKIREERRKRVDAETRLAALREEIASERKQRERRRLEVHDKRQNEKLAPAGLKNAPAPSGGKRMGVWIVYDNGVAVDTRTRLMWMTRDFYNAEGRPPAGWREAIAWVDRMNEKKYGGYDDWRAPSAAEYQGVYDARRGKRGFSFRKSRGSFARVFEPKPVGYPDAFDDGGGYWYWTREKRDPSLCAISAPSRRECLAVFNFRDGITGAYPPNGGDAATSSVRLVREID